MKVTLNLLKIGSSANISAIKAVGKTHKYKVERLYSLGFAPGRSVTLLNKNKDLYIARIDNDNPFCLREDLAKLIEVSSVVNNLYKNQNNQSLFKNFISTIKKFFSLHNK